MGILTSLFGKSKPTRLLHCNGCGCPSTRLSAFQYFRVCDTCLERAQSQGYL